MSRAASRGIDEDRRWVMVLTRNRYEWQELLYGEGGLYDTEVWVVPGELQEVRKQAVDAQLLRCGSGGLIWISLDRHMPPSWSRMVVLDGVYRSAGYRDPTGTLPLHMSRSRGVIEGQISAMNATALGGRVGEIRTMSQSEVWEWLGLTRR